jgi:hypothetical protein
MGRVVISPNITKTSVRIDGRGNEIDPKTKEVIKPAEVPYVPPVKLEEKPKSDVLGDRIQKMIEEKVNKIVEAKIEEALKNLL